MKNFFLLKSSILLIFAISTNFCFAQSSQTDIIRMYFASVDEGTFSKTGSFLAEDCLVHSPLSPQAMDKKSWTGVGVGFKAGFSDLKHDVESYLESGQFVVARGFLRGKNDGQFMGNAPTGNRVNTAFTTIFEIDKDKKIKTIYPQFDLKTFEHQLLGGDPNVKIEQAKKSISEAYDALNRNAWDEFAALCDAKKYMDVGVAPAPIIGVKDAIEGYKQFYSAFPDLKVSIHEIATISPSRYLLRVTLTGTHKGNLMGIAPTGAKINYDDCDLVELDAAGKIIYHQPTKGGAEIFRQIGITPGAKPTATK